MKKVAVLVQAYVATRVIIEVQDDFDMHFDELTDKQIEDAEQLAIPRLKDNISGENIESVEVDYEFPYDQGFDDSAWK